MLVGTLAFQAEHNYYPTFLRELLASLAAQDLSQLELGRHPLPGFPEDKAWMMVLEYDTAPYETMQPEVHYHFSDLQIVVSGIECMGWQLDDGRHEHHGDYLVARDLQFYQHGITPLNQFVAKPGEFYLFTPNTVHMTNIQYEHSSHVKKLVVKIHNDLLMEAL